MTKPSKFIRQFAADAFKRDDEVKRKSMTLYVPAEMFADIERCRKVLQMSRQELVLALVTEGWDQFVASLKDTEKEALGL